MISAHSSDTSAVTYFAEGDLVEYRPHGGCRAERGFVTSVNARFVFVRFGADTGAKACDPRDITRTRTYPESRLAGDPAWLTHGVHE